MQILKKLFRGIFYLIIALIASAIILYLSTSGDWKVAQTVAQDSTIQHITIDGVTFHAETHGSDTNRTTIVIHGGPGQDYRYLLPLKALADEFHLVFYDQRGTGLSPRVDPSELTMQSTLDDLHRIINHYSPDKKVNIIGHSWGAMVGSGYLAQHPERINKIVLCEPGFLTADMSKEFMRRTNGFKVDMNFKNILLIGKIVLRGLHVDGPDDQAIKDYIFQNLVGSEVENHPMAGYFCGEKFEAKNMSYWRLSMEASQSIPKSQLDADGNMVLDLVSGVENFPDTVLFIAGACNKFIGPDYQQKQVKHFPRYELSVIENAGHNMHIDQPEAFFKLVRAYFKESP